MIVYERSHPLKANKLDPDNGIVYVVAGGAGAKPEWFHPYRSWHTAQALTVPHLVQVVVAGPTLELQAIDEHDRLFDTVTLRKRGVRRAALDGAPVASQRLHRGHARQFLAPPCAAEIERPAESLPPVPLQRRLIASLGIEQATQTALHSVMDEVPRYDFEEIRPVLFSETDFEVCEGALADLTDR